MVDEGAEIALIKKDKSLLASGILSASGNFSAGDVIKILNSKGREFAKGITNYSCADLLKIKGSKSGSFKNVLDFKGPDEVIHKDNLAIL